MMEQKIKNAIQAAFVADALSLGAHWEYDAARIKEKFGRIEHMAAPELVPYHKGKQAGQFTHYGDQMLVLLETVSRKKGFDLRYFCSRWQDFFKSYNGYVDHATKETLMNLDNGKLPGESGSGSADLAGASRIPPVFLGFKGDLDRLVRDVRAQTAMTHNHPDVLDTAEWTARSAVRILAGSSPKEAMNSALMDMDQPDRLKKMVGKGLDSQGADTTKTIQLFGQFCAVNGALPSAVHLVATYERDFETAMIENAMAGGDSSARGMLAAFLIGCHGNNGFIPSIWLDEMKAKDDIDHLLG